MNALNKQVNEIIKQRRETALKEAEFYLLKARENEEFCAIEKEINSLKFEIAKCEVKGEDAKNLIDEFKNLEKNKENLLKTLKISPKMLKPNYFCKVCNDTGFINGKECECKNKIRSEILLKNVV